MENPVPARFDSGRARLGLILPRTRRCRCIAPAMQSPTSVHLSSSPDGGGVGGDALPLQSSSASPPPPSAFASKRHEHNGGRVDRTAAAPSRGAGVSLSFEDLRVSTAPPLALSTRLHRAAWRWAHGRRLLSSPPPPLPPIPAKHILKGASGFIPANSLTGVMGGSGECACGARRGTAQARRLDGWVSVCAWAEGRRPAHLPFLRPSLCLCSHRRRSTLAAQTCPSCP
jgi:hypothetical protein